MKSAKTITLFVFCLFVNLNFLKAQDVITLRNGEDILAKVREVSTTEIKYNKMDNLTGPLYVLNKVEVFMIKYENGNKDVFGNTGSGNTGVTRPSEQKSVVIQPSSPVTSTPNNSKANEEEYNHYLKMSKTRLTKGIVCTSIGVPFTVSGLVLTGIGFNKFIMDEGFDLESPSSSSGLSYLIVGPVLTCVGIPLSIVGPINLVKSAKYARLAKEKKASLSFEPVAIPNAFGTAQTRSFNGGIGIKLSF